MPDKSKGNHSRGAHVAAKPADHRTTPAAAAFLIVAFVLLLIPSLGMLVAPTEATSENRELASEPSLTADDGTFNFNVLQDSGTYFEDHFAGRNQLVSLNASVRAALGSSATDQVVVGSEGWLYYGGTLYDYLGESRMTDRGLRNIAHNLSLLQGYANAQGASFVFTVAPDKSSVYPSHMPLYYLQCKDDSNAERLKPYLQEYGVNYVDSFELIESSDDTLYYQRDTHWNNQGALVVANALLQATGLQAVDVSDDQWVARDDYSGDLAGMLYPTDTPTETDEYAQGINDGVDRTGSTWSFDDSQSSVTDNWVDTSGSGTGSLLVYRDSFGNNLIPYMASATQSASFSKLVPYNALKIAETDADAVVLERAERHLSYLSKNAPIFGNPRVQVEVPQQCEASGENTTCIRSTNGPFIVLSGVLDQQLRNPDATIYVTIVDGSGNQRTMEAFTVSVSASQGADDADFDEFGGGQADSTADDYGYQVYCDASNLSGDIAEVRVFVRDATGTYGMKVFDSQALQQA